MSWQHDVLAALQARDARDKAFEPFVERYQRATALASALKRTNGALVAAAASAQPDEVEPAAAATATTTTLNKRDESKSSSKRTANSSAASVSSHGKSEAALTVTGGSPSPAVQAAYILSLEQQLSQLRAEVSLAYKTQSSNAQRLLGLTDQLREYEAQARADQGELARLRAAVDGLTDKNAWLSDVVRDKEGQIEILQDEHRSLELELAHLSKQNGELRTDNASLLQRWIEAKNQEVALMNEAFERESKERSSPPAAAATPVKERSAAAGEVKDKKAAAEPAPPKVKKSMSASSASLTRTKSGTPSSTPTSKSSVAKGKAPVR